MRLVGDPELAGRFTDPQGEMLSTVNIVDGIFTSQLDVSIIPTDVRVLAAAGNPLQSTDAPTLLDQLSDYRFATDAVRERGLAHLLTGKELDGNTAGIAFLGALCEPRAGVGLSEGWHGASIAALIMAHELGHNFGSPHDAQDGSPCVNTPAHFLMAPVVNFTSTFSACSREQMQPHIAAADCVVPLRIADVGIVAPAELQALIEEPFDIPIEVRAIGELTAENVHLRVVIGNVMPTGVTASGGTCSLAGAAVNCEFGALQPGEARQVTVRAVAGTPSGVAIIELTASNDRNHTNNNAARGDRRDFSRRRACARSAIECYRSRGPTDGLVLWLADRRPAGLAQRHREDRRRQHTDPDCRTRLRFMHHRRCSCDLYVRRAAARRYAQH